MSAAAADALLAPKPSCGGVQPLRYLTTMLYATLSVDTCQTLRAAPSWHGRNGRSPGCGCRYELSWREPHLEGLGNPTYEKPKP